MVGLVASLVLPLAKVGDANAPTIHSEEILREKYKSLPRILFKGDNGECVYFVKALTDKDYFGNAITWRRFINSPEPKVGSIFVSTAGPNGHIGVVLAVWQNSILVVERNYTQRFEVTERTLDKDDPSIIGYINDYKDK